MGWGSVCAAIITSACFGGGRGDLLGVSGEAGSKPVHSAGSGALGGADTGLAASGAGGNGGADLAASGAGGNGGVDSGLAESVWAVGQQGKIWLRTGEGHWDEWESPTDEDLNAVWGSAADDIWAVGNQGVLLHYDEKWSRVELAGDVPNLRAIHGRSANDVWAVGDGGTVLHRDGDRWTRIESPTTQNLLSVRAVSEDEVWMGGPVGGILEWDGRRLRERSITAAPIVVKALWDSEGGTVWALADEVKNCTVWEAEEWDSNRANYVLRKGTLGWVERLVTSGDPRALFGLAYDALWVWGNFDAYDEETIPGYYWDGRRAGPIELSSSVTRMWGTDPEHLWVVTTEGIARLLSDGIVNEGSMKPLDLWGPGPVTGCNGECADAVRSDHPRLTVTACPEEGCEAGVCDLTNTQGGTCFCLGQSHQENGECVMNGACADGPCGEHGSCIEVDGQAQCQCDTGYLPQQPAGCGASAARCTPEGWCLQDSGLSRARWHAIWATGPDDVWVIGEVRDVDANIAPAIVAHRGPDGWTMNSIDVGVGVDPSDPVDISGTGPEDVWVLIGRRLYHFDGMSWAPLDIDSGAGLVGIEGEVGRVHAVSPDEVWVTASYASFTDGGDPEYINVPFLYRWDGSQWSIVQEGELAWQDRVCGRGLPSYPWLDELAMGAQQKLDALGLPPIALDPPLEPTGVGVAAEDDVYVIDDTRIAHYDGTGWSEEGTTLTPALMRLQASKDGSRLWVAGGNTFSAEAGVGDGVAWTWSDEAPCIGEIRNGVYEVCTQDSEFVIGYCGDTLSWYDGTAWETQAAALGFHGLAKGIIAASAEDVWLTGVDTDGSWEPFAAHWDGAHWQFTDPPATTLGPLALDPDSGLWAVGGDDARIARLDGGNWVFEPFDGQPFERILVPSADNVWAVAPDKIVHWDGETWTIELTGEALRDACLDAEGRLWVAAEGTVYHYDGDGWVGEHLPAGISVSRIAATQDRVWAGGYGYPFASRPLD
jgi:hypothetical protein